MPALEKFKRTVQDRPLLLVLLLIAAYTIYASYCAILRYYEGHCAAFDLGIYMQSLWSSVHGHSLLYTTLWEGSRFAMHFEPIMFLLMPFYALFPGAAVLLIIQSVALGICALPVYWIARDKLGERAGVLYAAIFLVSPVVYGVNQDEFHGVALAVPFLFFSFYLFKKQHFFWGLVLAIFAMMCKENVPTVVIFMGLYWLWEERVNILVCLKNRTLPRSKAILYPVALCVLGLIWLYGALYVAIPHFNPEGEHVLLNRYENPIQDLFADPAIKIGYFACLFGPLLLTSLFHPPTLLIGLPIFVQNLATDHVDMYHIWTQHSALLIPWLFIASIYGVKNIPNIKNKYVGRFYLPGYKSGQLIRWQLYASLTFLLGMSFIAGPLAGKGLTPSEMTVGLRDTAEHYDNLQQVIELIDGPVYAQSNLFPFICHRYDVYHTFEDTRFFEGYRRATGDEPIPWSSEGAVNGFEYIFMDENVNDPIVGSNLKKTYMMDATDAESKQRIEEEYGLYAHLDGISLYKKGYAGEPIALE